MKQYCRYCAYCSYGDVPYCEVKDTTMSEDKIKRANKCADFGFNEIDVINGGIYKERKASSTCERTLFDEV